MLTLQQPLCSYERNNKVNVLTLQQLPPFPGPPASSSVLLSPSVSTYPPVCPLAVAQPSPCCQSHVLAAAFLPRHLCHDNLEAASPQAWKNMAIEPNGVELAGLCLQVW